MTLATVLWIVAVILVIAGVFAIIRRQVLWGCRADRGRSPGRPRRGQHLHLTPSIPGAWPNLRSDPADAVARSGRNQPGTRVNPEDAFHARHGGHDCSGRLAHRRRPG